MAKPPSPPRNVEEAKSDMELEAASLNSVVESLEAGGVHPAAIVITLIQIAVALAVTGWGLEEGRQMLGDTLNDSLADAAEIEPH